MILTLDSKILTGRHKYITGEISGKNLLITPDIHNCQYVSNFAASVVDINGRRFLYYSVYSNKPLGIAVAEIDGEALKQAYLFKRGNKGFFTVAGLPKDWVPLQPIVLPVSERLWRMFFWAHGGGVVRYITADSTDGLHWKVNSPDKGVLYHYLDRAVEVEQAIPKGLVQWRPTDTKKADEPNAPIHLITNDANCLYPMASGGYEVYSPGLVEVERDSLRFVGHDNASGSVRVIDRRISLNNGELSKPDTVLVPDKYDSNDLQFYYLSSIFNSDIRLGFIGRYMVDSQKMQLEATISTDGRNWIRKWRNNCMPLTEDYESFGVYVPNNGILEGSKLLLYYTATNYPHNKSGDKTNFRSVIATAHLDLNRFIGLKIDNGQVLLPVNRICDKQTALPVEALEAITVEYCDPWGKVYANLKARVKMEKHSCLITHPSNALGRIVRLKISGSFTLFEKMIDSD